MNKISLYWILGIAATVGLAYFIYREWQKSQANKGTDLQIKPSPSQQTDPVNSEPSHPTNWTQQEINDHAANAQPAPTQENTTNSLPVAAPPTTRTEYSANTTYNIRTAAQPGDNNIVVAPVNLFAAAPPVIKPTYTTSQPKTNTAISAAPITTKVSIPSGIPLTI